MGWFFGGAIPPGTGKQRWIEQRRNNMMITEKDRLINSFGNDLLGYWRILLAHGMSDAEAADKLYEMGEISYIERDILKGE